MTLISDSGVILHSSLKVLIRRIFLTVKSFFSWESFPKYTCDLWWWYSKPLLRCWQGEYFNNQELFFSGKSFPEYTCNLNLRFRADIVRKVKRLSLLGVKWLLIQTCRRQTSWLYTKQRQEAELRATEIRINPMINRVEGLDLWCQISSLVLQPLGHTASTTFNLSCVTLPFRTKKLSQPDKSVWCPRPYTIFKLLLSARFCSAFLSNISDCDETFNYWEPVSNSEALFFDR